MTNDEAIKHLTSLRIHSQNRRLDKDIEALDKAIEVLEQQPCEDAVSREPFTNSTICEGFSCEECSFNRKDKGGCILEERVMKLPPVNPQEPRKGYLSIDDVMSVFDDFMCGEVDEDGTETFLEMLKDKAEREDKE